MMGHPTFGGQVEVPNGMRHERTWPTPRQLAPLYRV